MQVANRKRIIILSVIILAVSIFLISFYFKAKNHIVITANSNGVVTYGDEMSAYGTLGDYFGGIVNPILGFITFISLLYTINLQLNQSSESRKQIFEASFYNLINLHNNLISNLNYKDGSQRQSFKSLIEDRLKLIDNEVINSSNTMDGRVKNARIYSRTRRSYRAFNKNDNGYFGHYFRSLYRILYIIDNSSLTQQDKNSYARILRAQLSMDELIVLYLNCLPLVCDRGAFRKLLIRYQILEHLSVKRFDKDPEPLTENNYISEVYTIGGKVKTIGKDLSSYLPKNTSTNANVYGAFGQNNAVCLRELVKVTSSLIV